MWNEANKPPLASLKKIKFNFPTRRTYFFYQFLCRVVYFKCSTQLATIPFCMQVISVRWTCALMVGPVWPGQGLHSSASVLMASLEKPAMRLSLVCYASAGWLIHSLLLSFSLNIFWHTPLQKPKFNFVKSRLNPFHKKLHRTPLKLC